VTAPPTRTVAAFDFDGTLSSRDSFVRFVRLVAGTTVTARAMAAAAPALVASRREPTRRDEAKAILLRETMRGRPADHLRDLGARYARMVVTRHLNPAVVARLQAHRDAGHEVVIVSASLTDYLDPAAALLGVCTVLATRLEVGPDGRCTGELAGPNVRGPEKAVRLDAWLGGEPAVVYAYGDSHGDAELLARADHGVLVDRRGRLPESDPGAPPPRR
jgi:phosphatidylglycerophosphatase C